MVASSTVAGPMIAGDPAASRAFGDQADVTSAQDSSGDPGVRWPAPRVARDRPRPIRRVPKPRMSGLLDSPVRNLTVGIAFMIVVMVLATAAYMAVGWSFRDALYMVIITVYTVGYDEIRPINTPALDAITIALIVLGCTGMIFLTGALVQFITAQPAQQGHGSEAHEKHKSISSKGTSSSAVSAASARAGAIADRKQRRLGHPRRERSARRRGPPSGLSLHPGRRHQRGRSCSPPA